MPDQLVLSIYFAIVLCLIVYDSETFVLIKQLGVVSSLVLALAGNKKAISSLSSIVPASSAIFPHVTKRSFIGLIMCELNTLLGLGFSWILTISNPVRGNLSLYNMIVGFSGMIVGFSTYYSSLSIGITFSAIALADAKNSEAFSKLIVLGLVPTMVGILGFVLGICTNSAAESFLKDS